MKRGQIRKTDQRAMTLQCDKWVVKNRNRIESLAPKFGAWVLLEIEDVKRRIEEQDYLFAVQSQIRHIVTTLARFERGEISDVSADGTCFTLAR